MMRYRTLGTPRESCCCLPTPYRIPQPVAGLAFNFSLIELPEARQKVATPPQPEAAATERSLFSFGMQRYSAAT